MKRQLFGLAIAVGVVLSAQPVYARRPDAGNAWTRLALVSQKKSKTQLVCRYARTGETRRQLLKQEAVVVFRLPKSTKGRALACPRPSPGRTNLVTFTNNLRRHPTLGKLLLRLTLSPVRGQ